MKTTLLAPAPLWDAIRTDLLSTPHVERAAVGFAGRVRVGSEERLLLRDWSAAARDEYIAQLGYHLEVSPVFWARAAKRARESGEALVILHSHPRDESVPSFSGSDDAGEATLIPKIRARANVPVAAVVVSTGGQAGRIAASDGRAHRTLSLLISGEIGRARAAQHDVRFDRQVRALGRDGQSVLTGLRVGVVGTGGLGSHVAQQLIHLGIGHLTVVDPDKVTLTNLSRLVGGTRWDARRQVRKTRVVRRLARKVGGPTRVHTLDVPVEENVGRQLLECDVVLGCTDNQTSRVALNTLAFKYYVPVLDLGVELQAAGAMGGRVTWLVPGGACLWCAGILDSDRVRREQLPEATLKAELEHGYIQGRDEPAPAVVSINGVVASIGVTELLARATGFAGPDPRAPMLLYRLSDGSLRRAAPQTNPNCPTCSAAGNLGAGDLAAGPWRDRAIEGLGQPTGLNHAVEVSSR